MKKIICDVYKSSKKDGFYLYVEKQAGFERVPGELQQIFNPSRLALSFILESGRKLASVDGERLRSALIDQGYYLQMPLIQENEMREISQKNCKLSAS